jgi:hypothetical protein
VFEVLATGGDSALGGDDYDHALADWVAGASRADSRSRRKTSAVLDGRGARMPRKRLSGTRLRPSQLQLVCRARLDLSVNRDAVRSRHRGADRTHPGGRAQGRCAMPVCARTTCRAW